MEEGPWVRLEAELVDHVEAALQVGVEAELLVVGRVEVRTERRAMAPWNVGLDPLVEAHFVEPLPRAGVRVVERREGSRVVLVVEDLHDRVEVFVRLAHRVVFLEEVERVVRAGGLGGDLVDQGEAEPLGERDHRRVSAVEELAAPLARLVVQPRGRVRVHASADAARRLVDGGGKSRVLERERRVQPRDAGAHDGDPRCGPRCSRDLHA